jgi:hypothetical protein
LNEDKLSPTLVSLDLFFKKWTSSYTKVIGINDFYQLCPD